MAMPFFYSLDRIRLHPKLPPTLCRYGTPLQAGPAETAKESFLTLDRSRTLLHEPVRAPESLSRVEGDHCPH